MRRGGAPREGHGYHPAMPRRRYGVVLFVPEPAAGEIQGLRRALGDGALDQVAPHLTLVPPVNVREDDIADGLRVLREAAAHHPHPLTLELGPPASFAPDTDTVYLRVGDDDALDSLHALRGRVFRPPFERSLERPFVAHVTLADGLAPARIEPALAVLDHYRVSVSFTRLHLLEEHRVGGQRRWIPVADAPFARPTVVGRGGVELELGRSELVDPVALELLVAARERDPIEHDDDELLTAGDEPLPKGAVPVVITARRGGETVAVGTGWRHNDFAGEITAVAVAFAHHGQGIARQIILALEHAIDGPADEMHHPPPV